MNKKNRKNKQFCLRFRNILSLVQRKSVQNTWCEQRITGFCNRKIFAWGKQKDPQIKSWSDQITLRTQRGVSNLRVLDPANPGFAGRIEKQRREAIPQLGMQEHNMAKRINSSENDCDDIDNVNGLIQSSSSCMIPLILWSIQVAVILKTLDTISTLSETSLSLSVSQYS